MAYQPPSSSAPATSLRYCSERLLHHGEACPICRCTLQHACPYSLVATSCVSLAMAASSVIGRQIGEHALSPSKNWQMLLQQTANLLLFLLACSQQMSS